MAFAQHYYDAMNWATATGDMSPLKGVAASTCSDCWSFVEVLDAVAVMHTHLRGGQSQVLELDIVAGSSPPSADEYARVKLRQGALTVTSETGETIEDRPAATRTEVVHLRWHDAGWQIVDISESATGR